MGKGFFSQYSKSPRLLAKEKPIWKSFVMRLDVRAESIKACFKGERELGPGSGKQPPTRALVPFAAARTFLQGFPWLHRGVLGFPGCIVVFSPSPREGSRQRVGRVEGLGVWW